MTAIVFSPELPHPGSKQPAYHTHKAYNPVGWVENAADSQHYRFSGAEMESDPAAKTFQINSVQLELYQANGDISLASADFALLNEAEQTILLQGDVSLSHGANHCLRTNNVLLYKQGRYATINTRLREIYGADSYGTGVGYSCSSATGVRQYQ